MNLVVLSHLESVLCGQVNGNIFLIASYDFFVNRRNKPTTIAVSSTRE